MSTTHMRSALTIFGLGTALVVTGCSGGSQSATPPASKLTAPPTTLPQQKASVTLSILIPNAAAQAAARRRPRYISPATNSLSFAQNGNVTTVVALTPSSPGCSPGPNGTTCTVTVTATSGQNQSFTVKTFASSDGSGPPLSVQTVVATIVTGVANPLNLVLNGVIASLTAAFTVASLPYGLAGATTLTVNELDASGNIIVGPGGFANASGAALTVTVTNGDATGSTSLAQTSLTQPGAPIGFTYTGGGLNTDTVTASASGVTSANATIAFTCNPTPSTSALFVLGQFPNFGYGLYPLSISGTSPAPSSVVDPPGILGYPLAVDSAGRAYTFSGSVSNGIPQPGASIEEFCPQASGTNAVPYRSVTVSGDFTVDSARNLYVLQAFGAGAMLEYPPDSGLPGPVPSTEPTTAPERTISGAATELSDASASGIAASAATTTNFYATVYNEILDFGSGQSGNVAPASTIANTAPGLLGPESVAVDGSGNVYVLYQTDYLTAQPAAPTYNPLFITLPAIAEYAANGTLLRVISGPNNTDMGDAISIAVDGVGNVWVNSVVEYTGETGFYPQVESFAPGASGDASPATRFAMLGETSPLGSSTSLDLQQLAVDPTTGNVYVCDSAGYGVIVYNGVGNYLGQILPSQSGLGAAYGIAFSPSGNFVVQSQPLTSGSVTYGSAQLQFYPALTGTTGTTTAAPTNVVNLSSTYGYPAPIALDAAGNVYELGGENGSLIGETSSDIGDSYTYTIAEYAANAGPNASPVSTFYDVANTDLTGLTLGGIGVTPTGTMLVGNNASNVVYGYAAGTSGSNAVPSTSYQDFAPSTYFVRSLAVDPAGNLYAASFNGATITEFAAGSSTIVRSIAGPHTRLLHPQGIAVDASDNIYVGNQYGDTLSIFGPGQSGDAAPQRVVGVGAGPETPSNYQYMAIGPGNASGGTPGAIGRSVRTAATTSFVSARRAEALKALSVTMAARCAARNVTVKPPTQRPGPGSAVAACATTAIIR